MDEPVREEFDLIVAGGGLSGVAAAVAAAREGLKVLIVERYGFLGGMATAGLVNPFMAYTTFKARWQKDWDNIINKGMFAGMLNDLREMGGLHEDGSVFNEEILKLVLDRTIRRHEVKVLFHSFVCETVVDRKRLRAVKTIGKSGPLVFGARYFVDATGDADLSAMSGVDCRVGRDEDGACQPMTLCFRLVDVDFSRCDKETLNRRFIERRDSGELSIPRHNVLSFNQMSRSVRHFNSTRILGKSALDVEDLTDAEMEGREQAWALYQFLKKEIPGFEESKMLMSGPQIGVRESRRIVGEYTITVEDVRNAVKFDDSIARGSYPIDIHDPTGNGTTLEFIPFGDYFTIPYRALLPMSLDNLVVAGRPISSDHEAHASFRVMPICACVGEGAGAAVALAAAGGKAMRDVAPDDIQERLDQHGALY